MGLCVFSLWLAFLSYRYVRFSSRYLGTPPHTLHSGREDCLVIFDGDSLTAGDGLSNETETYPFQAMAASGHSCTWENIAVSGALAGDRLGSPARLDSHGLRLYIIWVGSNDLMYRQEPVAEIWREMEEGLQARSRQGWRIAVGTITPRIQALRPDREIALFFGLFGPRSFESRRAVLNELIRRGASRGDFQLIDFAASPGVNRPDSVSSHYYLPDRAHFSASGSGVLARTAAPVVSAMLSSLLSQ